MLHILDYFKSVSVKNKSSVYDYAKSMSNTLELEVIAAVIKGYIPGERFSLDVLTSSLSLQAQCKKIAKFCAMNVTQRDMYEFVLPKPVYLDDLQTHFDIPNNPDLRIYILVAAPMYKAACHMIYGEFLRLTRTPSEKLISQRLDVLLTETIDICNQQSLNYYYDKYAPMIAVRKACLALGTFMDQLEGINAPAIVLNYSSTSMSMHESAIVQHIEGIGRA